MDSLRSAIIRDPTNRDRIRDLCRICDVNAVFSTPYDELSDSSKRRRINVCDILLEHGANPDHVRQTYESGIRTAVHRGDLDLVKLILSRQPELATGNLLCGIRCIEIALL